MTMTLAAIRCWMTETIELIIILLLMVIQHGGDDVSCKRSIVISSYWSICKESAYVTLVGVVAPLMTDFHVQ